MSILKVKQMNSFIGITPEIRILLVEQQKYRIAIKKVTFSQQAMIPKWPQTIL
jgi:hypothetical protein